MADEPISQLTQIAAPPFATACTNPSSGAMLEILDTTNTSMASSGTNSKIAPGDLLKGYLAAGSNVTLTETSGIVTVAASGGVTNTYETAVMSASTLIPGSTFSSMGISVTLPTPGTYMLSGVGRCSFTVNGALGQGVFVVVQLYDTTNSVAVPNSPVLLILADLQVASTNVQFQQSSTIGPVFYTTTSANVVIQLQAMINGTGTITSPYLNSDSNGWTSISAVRIA